MGYAQGFEFEEFQSIPTQGALDWEYFTIGSDHYLAVANHHNDSTYNINSTLYRWHGASFVEYQSIPTQGARDWEF
ncbi:EPTP domain protein, partial [Candidatus Thiomargarita nelsonii]